jgi:Flp pilus assembly pilin Flp
MKRQRGGISVEYLIVTALVAMVLINGDLSPLERIVDAFRDAYSRFTNAMSHM